MQTYRSSLLSLIITAAAIISQACTTTQPTVQVTPTNTPTATPIPSITSTSTHTPTETPAPTATPNAIATEFTQRSDQMRIKVQEYVDAGYLQTTEGTYVELADFEQNWAQINYYQWWPADIKAKTFVLDAHFKWDSASSSANPSGCGFAVGNADSAVPQAFFLVPKRVLVLNSLGQDWGLMKGTGRVDSSSLGDADITLIVNSDDLRAYVLVNDQFVGKYQLQENGSGELGLTILSGTNKDYGTHCKVTDVRIWKIG